MTTDAELREILDDYDACERQELNLTVLAFTIARKIVQNSDPALLSRLSDKLREAVLDMARVCVLDGELVSQSNLGRVFHNELGDALSNILRSSGRYSLS